MSEEDLMLEARQRVVSPWERHRFIVMIAGSIVISLALVSVALALYSSSGAAQLDLSRPGYVSVREKVTQTGQFEGFSASGPVDAAALEQFRKLYDEQAKAATSIDSFGGDILSDQALSIDSPASE
jgi:hypothetical protein